MPWQLLLIVEIAVILNLTALVVAAIGVLRELLRDRRERRR
jgi:hypothetical protein